MDYFDKWGVSMKKSFLILVIVNLIPCIFLLLWFGSMCIYTFLGFNNYNINISYKFLSIFMFYTNNYIFIFDSIILLIYCILVSVKNFCRSFLKYIIVFIIINIFNILIDLFVYDAYCFLMSV